MHWDGVFGSDVGRVRSSYFGITQTIDRRSGRHWESGQSMLSKVRSMRDTLCNFSSLGGLLLLEGLFLLGGSQDTTLLHSQKLCHFTVSTIQTVGFRRGNQAMTGPPCLPTTLTDCIHRLRCSHMACHASESH